jgi:hypothetical protein
MSTKKEKVRAKFSLGDVVTWTSQAAGASLKKQGTVIEVVVPAHTPSSDLGHHAPGTPRDHESYVIEVQQQPRNERRPRKPKRYWPIVSLLQKVELTAPPLPRVEETQTMEASA